MIGRVNIQFRHALYDNQGLHSGLAPLAEPGEYEQVGSPSAGNAVGEEISSLNSGAQSAVAPEEAYYFDTLGRDPPMFTVGFVVDWSGEDVRAGEFFYDVYATPLEFVQDVSLPALVAELYANSEPIRDKSHPIDQKVQIEVPERRPPSVPREEVVVDGLSFAGSERVHGPRESGRADSGSRSDPAPDPAPRPASDPDPDSRPPADSNAGHRESGPEGATPELRLVAEIWECYRRDAEPVRLSLYELDLFTAVVEDALGRLSFVSRTKQHGDPHHFDTVGGRRDTEYDYGETLAAITDRVEAGTIRWLDLPRYQHQLHRRIDRQRRYLGTDPGALIRAERDREWTAETSVGYRLAEAVGPEDKRVGFYATLWEDFLQAYFDVVYEIESTLQGRAHRLFEAAVDPAQSVVEEEDDDGVLGRFTGKVRGDDDRPDSDVRAVLDGLDDVDTIDEEVASAIAEELVSEVYPQLVETVEERISNDLRLNVKRETKARSRSLANETIRRADHVRDHRSYEQTLRKDQDVFPSEDG